MFGETNRAEHAGGRERLSTFLFIIDMQMGGNRPFDWPDRSQYREEPDMAIGNGQKRYEDALALAEGIRRMSDNIWWTWNPRAQDLMKRLSAEAWVLSNHSATNVIQTLSRDELVAQLYSRDLQKMAREVINDFNGYMTEKNTWGAKHCPQFKKNPVAYFSAEFGMHECLPIYSGGLGILSGDHIKSASDLDVGLVGVTLFYRNGYFIQRINHDGWQEEEYTTLDPHKMPIERVLDKEGKPFKSSVRIAHSDVNFTAWKLLVGRCTLYLIDTHLPENDEHWRESTSRVYGGDQATRVAQELLLGIGGVKLLRGLGIEPSVFHLNEGHSSFLLIELMREKIEQGKTLDQAREEVKKEAVFTTHTPVPAGHDRFTADLLDHLMHSYPGQLKLEWEQFMDLGRVRKGDTQEPFCMTVLALETTRAANAVSELNGAVSRDMWRELYGNCEAGQVPIGHITNGIHTLGWMNRVTYNFWERTLGVDWLNHIMKANLWEKINDPEVLPDEEIWALRYSTKRQMIEQIRKRLETQYQRIGVNLPTRMQNVLNPDALTIGFARRFATYKRGNMIFGDIDRAAALFNDPRRPIQIIFAGKAHPRDDDGKRLIQQIWQLSHDPRFTGRILFVENYDIQVARLLVSGCDVWLNNPRRPLEASGTSGMKCTAHGGLNCSIMDGWWREGYDGSNGFAIGGDHHASDVHEQDRLDAENLYTVLEKELIPTYYDRDVTNIPRNWIKRIRRAMMTLVNAYSTDRMVSDYVKQYYLEK